MSKYLSGIAALSLLGAATFALPAAAADRQGGVTATHQSTEVSSQHHWRGRHHARNHWGARRHWGPRYGYRSYGGPYYGYPYGYYAPPPLVQFGVGPFGFRVF